MGTGLQGTDLGLKNTFLSENEERRKPKADVGKGKDGPAKKEKMI